MYVFSCISCVKFNTSGATRSPGGSELLYARQKVVTVAKAFGLQAIDMVHIDYKGSCLSSLSNIVQIECAFCNNCFIFYTRRTKELSDTLGKIVCLYLVQGML